MENTELFYSGDTRLLEQLEKVHRMVNRCVDFLYDPDKFRIEAQSLLPRLNEVERLLADMEKMYARAELPLMEEVLQTPFDWGMEQDFIGNAVGKLDAQPHPKKKKRGADALIAGLTSIREHMAKLEEAITKVDDARVFVEYANRENVEYQKYGWSRALGKLKRRIHSEEKARKGEECEKARKEVLKWLDDHNVLVLNTDGYIAYREVLGKRLWYCRHNDAGYSGRQLMEQMLVLEFCLKQLGHTLTWQDARPQPVDTTGEPSPKQGNVLRHYAEMQGELENCLRNFPMTGFPMDFCAQMLEALRMSDLADEVARSLADNSRRKFVCGMVALLKDNKVVKFTSVKELARCISYTKPDLDSKAKYIREKGGITPRMEKWMQHYVSEYRKEKTA